MARCGSCNKFVSYGDAEVEANIDIDDDGRIDGSVQLVLTCGECGDGLVEGDFDVRIDATAAVDLHKTWEAFVNGMHKLGLAANGVTPDDDDIEHEFEVEAEAESTERSEGKGRGRTTFYGHHTTVVVTCSCGGFEFVAECDDDMQASHMDVLS